MLSYLTQDPEKGPVPAFLPFQRSISADDEPEVHYKTTKYRNYVYVYSYSLLLLSDITNIVVIMKCVFF